MKRISIRLVISIVAVMVLSIMPFNCYAAEADLAVEEESVAPTAEEYLICNDSIIQNEGDAGIMAITYFTVGFKRIAPTTAQATVTAKSTATSKSIKSTVYLQKYNSSTGKYATVSGVTATKTVYTHSITHNPKFSVTSNGKYRAKVVIEDTTSTETKYKTLL